MSISLYSQAMEEDGNQGLLCGWRIYQEAPQVWEIYSSNGKYCLKIFSTQAIKKYKFMMPFLLN